MRKLKRTPAMEKSYQLGLRIVQLCRELGKKKQEYELARQLLKSGTSIGANVAEAQAGISTADLSAKMGIAYKEAQETKFWLNLLFDSQLLEEAEFNQLLELTDEIARILYSILKKTRYQPDENLLQEPDLEYLLNHIE